MLAAPRVLTTPILTTPRRAEQESEAGYDRQRRVGARLDRFIDGVDEMVGDFAHGVDRFAAGILRAGNHVIDTGARLLPGVVALGAEDFADLVGELGEIVAQRLEIGRDVAGRLACRLLDLAKPSRASLAASRTFCDAVEAVFMRILRALD